MGKGKEKKIKQEAIKRAKIEESIKGTETGLETKKRKTAKSSKQLIVSEEPKRVDPSTFGKEVGHFLIPKIRVKTKVKFSVFQVPVSSLAHGSSGPLTSHPKSPLGPSRPFSFFFFSFFFN